MTGTPEPRTIDETASRPHNGARCRYCHAPIFWRTTQAGKWQPMSLATGQPHFADCRPYLDAHRPTAAATSTTPQEDPIGQSKRGRERHADGAGRPWYDR